MTADVGYLSNKRMALEVGIGLAHLSGRTLSLPIDLPIGSGPRPAITGAAAGPPSSLADLYDLPVAVLGDAAYAGLTDRHSARTIDWPDLNHVVVVGPPEIDDRERPGDLEAFAQGRDAVSLDPAWEDAPLLDLPARGLAFYSFLFFLGPERRRSLFELLERIAPRPPYAEFARALADDLGRFNAAHIRRTDMLDGIRASRGVTPWAIRDNLASIFPSDERLVVCSEADPASGAFGPLLDHFDDVVFLTQAVLEAESWPARFSALPRHDDPALALITQEVATRADRFVGTFGSTFTAMIHRLRHWRDPAEPFRFTADYLGGETRFEECEYQAVRPGPYTWNRLGYPVGPDALAWMREWPEVNAAAS